MTLSTEWTSAPVDGGEFAVTGPDHRCPAPLQLVSPEGTLTERGRSVPIDWDLAQKLHRTMVLARRLDHEALALQRQGELNLWLMSWGQEAAQVGSIAALRTSDMVFPSYREHAAALWRGITPAELLAQWRGLRNSGWNPADYRFHIYSLVLGVQTLHAVGYAAGAAMEATDEVVMTYFGDGASSEGDVNEALNWSSAGSLPVLFFCQNNHWAISTPIATQMRTPMYRRARGFGLHAYHVDGNDALAVHAVTAAAAERVRAGGGPGLIEAETYRLGGHSSSDDPTKYRSKDELETWQQRDPVTRLERLLRKEGIAEAWFSELAQEAEDFAADVRRTCRSLAGESLETMFDHVYAAPHAPLAEQKVRYVDLRRRLGAL